MSLVSYIRQPRTAMQKLLLYPGNKKAFNNYLIASFLLVIGLMFFPFPQTSDYFFQILSFNQPLIILTLLGIFILFFAIIGLINLIVSFLTAFIVSKSISKIEPELLFQRFLLGYSELMLISSLPQALAWLNIFKLGLVFAVLAWAAQIYALYLAYLMIATALNLFR